MRSYKRRTKNYLHSKTQRFAELEYLEFPLMPGALEVLKKVQTLKLQRIIVTRSGQYSLFEKLDKNYPSFLLNNFLEIQKKYIFEILINSF